MILGQFEAINQWHDQRSPDIAFYYNSQQM